MPGEREQVQRVLAAYPKIYLACHMQHPGRQSGERLTDREVHILGHLIEESVGAGALARHMSVTATTMSGVLDGLEKRGLVVRRRETPDRRRVVVALTPQGRRAMERSSILDADRIAGVLASLPGDTRDRLVEAIVELARAAIAYSDRVPKRARG